MKFELDCFKSEQTYSDLVTEVIKKSVAIDFFFNEHVRVYFFESCNNEIWIGLLYIYDWRTQAPDFIIR